MQTCSANKVWEDTPCTLPKVCSEESGTATCADAAASEDCTAGEIKCVDDGTTAELWTCNESKSWVKKPCPASTVSGARLTCRNAETCSTYLCTTPGMYFNSASKSCDNFNHSNGCTQGRTYCNSDTNYLYECLETNNSSPLLATDCGAENKKCVKLSDEKSVCVAEECTGNFCEGETLVFCTSSHQIEYEGSSRHEIDCTASDRICDINENGDGECTDPCTPENGVVCDSSDETHRTYFQCINQHWGRPRTCEDDKTCQNEGGKAECK